ncbi:TasA family protein [Arthrobacter crystallopoietes]|uniref:TasA family protein n=1 Tax=Crystallibacter crystallopoietes TaxID=37928 RepID=UPI003D207E7B
MAISMKTTSGKLLASAALVATAAAVAGLGTFGEFSSTTEANQQVATGTVSIDINKDGGSNNFNVNAAGVLPGDSIQRVVELKNSSSAELGSLTLTTAAAANSSSVLDSDPDGLKLSLDSCSVAWSGTPSTGYTCGGTATNLVADSQIIGSYDVKGSLTSSANGIGHLRVTSTLPKAAGDKFQGKTSVLTFSFNAGQRTTAQNQ